MSSHSHEQIAGLVVLRPGELTLKGKNLRRFEQRLFDNVRGATGQRVFKRSRGRYYLGPVDDAESVARRCARVFGIASTSPVVRVAAELEPIAARCAELTAGWLERRGASAEGSVPFRVTVRRQDKRFPLRGNELAAELGARLLDRFSALRVDLHQAQLELGVEVRDEGCFLFAERYPGVGGLPVGVEGRVLTLLSGGIDSPVAAWRLMKRGCRSDFVHFDARPFTGPGSLEKVRALAEALRPWQGKSSLWVVPFSKIQVAYKDCVREDYRTLLYRRAMLRIADRIGQQFEHYALASGDSLGQVASQTLENLACVDAAPHELPLLRPLLGYDKEETIAIARDIGTYEISIRPFEDCCTLFQPERPATSGRRWMAEKLEQDVPLDALIDEAVEGTEREPVRGAPQRFPR
jgi:thiamine biosynthesis protein ThiI